MKETLKRIEALEANISNASAEIKKLKDELIEPVFEIGRWYKEKDENKLLLCITDSKKLKGYGFTRAGDWASNFHRHGDEKLFVPATESEVFEALEKEAIKRAGDGTIKCLHGASNSKISDIKSFDLNQDGCLRYWTKKGGRGCVFDPNEKQMWAEIIKDEPFKICGYEVKKEGVDYKIGGKTIYKSAVCYLRYLMTSLDVKTAKLGDYKVTLEEINKLLEL